ncbi:hypothetical protein Tco_1118339, partial [Tanacetum coccineum]
MSVLHCMMMSHGGELLARYLGLNQSHHECVSGLNDKLFSSDASITKSKVKGKEMKKKIKSLTKSLDNLHTEVARLFAALNQAAIIEAKSDERSFVEFKVNFFLWLICLPGAHNEEMLSVKVDGSDPKMTDDTITSKSGHAFVQGMSVVLDDAV